MTQQTTIDMLKAMRMNAMAAEFEKQMGDPAFRDLGFEDRLGLLVNAEWNRRQSSKVERLMRTACFSAPFACVEEIEYHEDRHLDKAEMLRLSTYNFVDERRHIVLKGASGNGKTNIACALGNAAHHRLKTVRYMRMPVMLDELSIARSSGELKKLLKAYKKLNLERLPELEEPLAPAEGCGSRSVGVWQKRREGMAKSPCTCGAQSGICTYQESFIKLRWAPQG